MFHPPLVPSDPLGLVVIRHQIGQHDPLTLHAIDRDVSVILWLKKHWEYHKDHKYCSNCSRSPQPHLKGRVGVLTM